MNHIIASSEGNDFRRVGSYLLPLVASLSWTQIRWHLSIAHICAFATHPIWSHFRSLQNSRWRYFCECGILFDAILQRSLPPKSATHKPSDSKCQKQVIKCNAGSNSWDLASSSRWRIKRSLATHIKMIWGTGARLMLCQKRVNMRRVGFKIMLLPQSTLTLLSL